MSQLWRIPEWFQWLDPLALERMEAYHASLCKWNKAINLISPGTVSESDRIHFADGILGCQIVMDSLPDGSEVWDLGSGNGVPGVIFSILRPDLKVHCLDSDERKMAFIKQLGLNLNLKNLMVVTERLEDGRDGDIVFATARGLAAVGKLLLIAEARLSHGGALFHFKGPEWGAELAKIPEKVKQTWSTTLLREYDLPLESGRRAILKSTRL